MPARRKRGRAASSAAEPGEEEQSAKGAKKAKVTKAKGSAKTKAKVISAGKTAKSTASRKRARSGSAERASDGATGSVGGGGGGGGGVVPTAATVVGKGEAGKGGGLGQTRAVHRFTPIYGALSGDGTSSSSGGTAGVSPMCYLLEFDGVNILLDCGASEAFDVEALEPLREIAPKVHLVLLSHARLEHLGALPYAVAKLGLNAPIYCTLPVKRMGEMYFYDALIAREWGPGAEEVRVACDDDAAEAGAASPLGKKGKKGSQAATADPSASASPSQPFTVDDVDSAFDRFRTLNYRQNLTVNTPGGTIVITPYPAGGGLGGALWGIKKETDLIVYANHFNHRNELHLQQCALGEPKLSKPTLLITDAYNADTAVPSRMSRDTRLFEESLRALRAGGNVLIPVDSGSRVLEICLAFDRHWATKSRGRGAYNLALFCPLHKSMLGIAQQNMNFMSEELSDQFSKDRINPFTFRYVHQCATREELDEIRGPKVVFASTNTLDYGCAHDLFGEWASDPKNLVVLTDRSAKGSLACQLAEGAKRADAVASGGGAKSGAAKRGKRSKKSVAAADVLPSSISFVERRHEDLEGVQLERWAAAREAERERRELERQQAAEKEEAANFRIDDGGKDAVKSKVDGAAAGGDAALATAASSSATASSSPSSSSSSAAADAGSSSTSATSASGEKDGEADLELKLVPLFAMFRYKDGAAHLDDYGVQGDLTAYMDQFALADATSAISLLVDGEGGDLVENSSKGSTKKRWKDRTAGGGKDDDLDEDDEDDDYDDYNDYDDDDALPQKLVEMDVTLDIKCRVIYIDMEGRSDDQSIKFMIERMAPRRVAFVHGSHAAAAKLKTKLDSKATPKDAIFLPKRGDSVEMRSDTKTFQIKMDDSLLNSLRMKKILGGDYEVARFRGVMRYPTTEELAQSAEASGGDATAEQSNDGGDGDDGDAAAAAEAAAAAQLENRQIMLFANAAEVAEGDDPVEAAEEEEVVDGRSAKKEDVEGSVAGAGESGGVWMGMGELKLSDLRARLREVGVRAEIKPGGILVCEGNVAISKVGPHDFSMDGVVGDMYYRIRQVIYQVLTYVP